MDYSLDGIQAKLYRAKEHMDAVADEVEAFINDGNPYEVVGQFEVDRHAWVERVKVNHDPPVRLGVLVGDWAHNLRSALDHLAYALTEYNGRTPTRKTQFPIIHRPGDFKAAAKRCVSGLTDAQRERIDSAQPYKAGDAYKTHPLYGLAELSNADKHRVVQATYAHLSTRQERQQIERVDDTPGRPPVQRITVAPPGQPMKDGAPILIAEFFPDETPVPVQVGGNFSLDVAFGDLGLSWNSLPTVSEYVVRVIEAFLPDFPDWEAPGDD